MNELPRTQALRCFITIAREGSVSRAATLLHLTQPAVSLQLKGLEESTGLQLFNRTPGGFTLTEAGAALLPLAHKAVSASSDFRTMAASLREQLRGTLRVGTILEPEFTRLGPFVRSLTASQQKTEVFLRHGDGKLQLAPLTRYDYRVIAPIAWSDRVMGKGWADLADLPWLATPLHSAHRRLTDDIFRPLGALPKRVAFTDQEEAVIDFVESGLCLGLARDGILDRVTRKRDFVIADKVALTCDLSFACLASRRHEDMIAHAFSAMLAVWDLQPASTGALALPTAPAETTRSRKDAAR